MDECAICYLGAGEALTLLRTTACGHTYCEHCIGSYALKVPPPRPLLCPLCRAPLSDAELPSTLTVTMKRTGQCLGAGLEKRSDEEHVSISYVTPGSLAAAAGLRVGMTLLSVNGVPLTSASDFAESVGARPLGASYQLVVGQLRVPRRDVPPTTSPPRQNFCLAVCCCFCNVMPQLWQRVFFPTKPSLCLAGACLLWGLGGASQAFDVLGTTASRRERALFNETRTQLVTMLERANLHEWANTDFSDGLNETSELFAFLSILALFVCWVIAGCK